MPFFEPISRTKIGDLDRRLTLQRPLAGAADQFGQPSVTWTTESKVWAQVEDIAGRELWYGQQIQAGVTTGVTILSRSGYRAQVTPAWRFLDERGNVLEIKLKTDDPDGFFQRLQCEQIIDVGITPAWIGSALAAWYDVSDPTTLYKNSMLTTGAFAENDPIGGIQDKSAEIRGGTARPILQATAGKLPLLKLAVQNFRPVVRFDGVNDFMQAGFTLAQPYTVYFVGKLTGGASSTALDGMTLNSGLLYVAGVPVTTSIFAGSNLSDGPHPSNVFLATAFFNGALSSIRVNNGTPTVGNAGIGTPGGITIAARGDDSTWSAVDLCELAIVIGTVATATDEQLLNYFNKRWALWNQ